MVVYENHGALNHGGWHHGVYDGGYCQFLGSTVWLIMFHSSLQLVVQNGGSVWPTLTDNNLNDLPHPRPQVLKCLVDPKGWKKHQVFMVSITHVGNIHIQAHSFVVWPMAFGSWHASISRACQSARRWLRERLRLRGRTQVFHVLPPWWHEIYQNFLSLQIMVAEWAPFSSFVLLFVNICPAFCSILQRKSHLLRVIAKLWIWLVMLHGNFGFGVNLEWLRDQTFCLVPAKVMMVVVKIVAIKGRINEDEDGKYW